MLYFKETLLPLFNMTEEEKTKKALALDSFEFVLSKPISYAVGGQMTAVNKVTICAPPANMIIKAHTLKQRIACAFAKAATLYAVIRDRLGKVAELEKEYDIVEEAKTPFQLGEEVEGQILGTDLDIEEAIDRLIEHELLVIPKKGFWKYKITINRNKIKHIN